MRIRLTKILFLMNRNGNRCYQRINRKTAQNQTVGVVLALLAVGDCVVGNFRNRVVVVPYIVEASCC